MNSILRKAGELGLNASAGTWYETKIRERKGQSGSIVQKGAPHERNPCASSFEERTPEETSRQADCTSKVAWNLARKYASSSRTSDCVLFSCEGARDTEDRMFIVDSGASMHGAEQERFELRSANTIFRKIITENRVAEKNFSNNQKPLYS